MQSSLTNAHSLHPTLSLNLPPKLLSTGCEPSILVHLPAGLFYDPYTAQNPIITQGRGSKRGYEVQYLGSEVELEGAVGWSTRRRAKGNGDGGKDVWFGGKDEDEEVQQEDGLGMEEMLQAALREKVAEFTGEQVQPDAARRVRRREKGASLKEKVKAKSTGLEEAKDEVSTLLIELKVDELRAADGLVKVEVPLHTRYQPPQDPAVRGSTTTALPPAHSPYLTLLNEILPSPITAIFHQAKTSALSLLGHNPSPPSTQPHISEQNFAEVSLSNPTLYLTCPSSSAGTKYVEGFYSTTLPALFPSSHAHLLPKKQERNSVLALSQSKNNRLSVKVPVPKAELLAPVQVTTLATVLFASTGMVYWLLANVVPLLEGVEKTL